MALRWGIASVGKISFDFVNALQILPKEDHQVVAVAAREVSRAEKFAKQFDIPLAYEGYVKLAEDPNVEVVYVATVNAQHFPVAKLMLEHGKHVLIEKPLCLNAKRSEQLIELAKQKKLFLMEAIWSRCFPSYHYIRQQILNGELGDIKSVTVDFGFPMDEIDRLTDLSLGGGSLFVLGVYNIQLCQWIFQRWPNSVTATGAVNANQADAEVHAEFSYGDDAVAHISISMLKMLSNTAIIRGTKGQITIKDFWAPTTIVDVDGNEQTWPLPQGKYDFNLPNSAGLHYEAEEVRKCIRANQTESEFITHDESLTIARIEDAIRKQICVAYADDNETNHI